MKYKFVVVEGFDGSGKSTFTKWLSEEKGYEFHKTPMGLFAALRVHFDTIDTNLVERFCFYAADCMRASVYIQNKMEQNQPVVLDRYYYSTIAYHESKYPGISKLLPEVFSGLLKPDLILYIKTNYPLTIDRMRQRLNSPDDDLFLTEEHYNQIDQNFKSLFDVEYKEISNTGSIEETKNQISSILF
jgi:dTMP kinase